MRLVWCNTGLGYFCDFAVAPLLALAAAAVATFNAAFLNAFLFGLLLAWPAVEWALHAKLFHRQFRGQHWAHHMMPRGDVGVPFFITVPAQVAVGLASIAALGHVVGAGLFAGFSLGYTSYVLTHWLIHTNEWPRSGWLGGVARRHDLHHRGVEMNFNVLNPIADLVAGTYKSA